MNPGLSDSASELVVDGRSDALAALHLNVMNKLDVALPWQSSLSNGRALRAAALNAWDGKAKNLAAAQAAYSERSGAKGAATLGAFA